MSARKIIQSLLETLTANRDVEELKPEDRFSVFFYHDNESKRNQKHSGEKGLVVAFDTTEKASGDTQVFVFLDKCDDLVKVRIAAFTSPTKAIKKINTVLGIENTPREKRRGFRQQLIEELFGRKKITSPKIADYVSIH